jgi:hypothetical protein
MTIDPNSIKVDFLSYVGSIKVILLSLQVLLKLAEI